MAPVPETPETMDGRDPRPAFRRWNSSIAWRGDRGDDVERVEKVAIRFFDRAWQPRIGLSIFMNVRRPSWKTTETS